MEPNGSAQHGPNIPGRTTTGFKAIIVSTLEAAGQFLVLIRTERAVRHWLIAIVITSALGYLRGFGEIPWVAMGIFYSMLIHAEVINTATEKLSDIDVELHNLGIDARIREAKHIGSAGVLVTGVPAGAAWIFFMIHPF